MNGSPTWDLISKRNIKLPESKLACNSSNKRLHHFSDIDLLSLLFFNAAMRVER